MQIAVVYATYSNSTFMACEYAVAEFAKRGHAAQMVLARETTIANFQGVHAVIFASPSWDRDAAQGMPHEDFDLLAQQLKGASLPTILYAIMGLGDSSYTYFCGAVDHIQKMALELQMKEMTGPLKIDNYYMNEQAAQAQITAWVEQIDRYLQSQGKKDVN